MKRDFDELNLRDALPDMPESCHDALTRAAFSVKEEPKVKRKIVRTVLIAALILAATTAAAIAAFYPQITAVFGQHYGEDFKTWLEKGDIALPDHSVQADGVTFTLNEVVYRNHGLYGLVTITPGEGIVLLDEDCSVDDAYGYAVHYGDKAPDGTPTIREQAANTGSAIKQVHFDLEKIGVDGGALLVPGDWGYGAYPQRDGSIQVLVEAEDGKAISQGETYTLQMTAIVCNVSAEGVVDYNNAIRQEWTAEMSPKPFSEVAGTTAPDTEAPAPVFESALSGISGDMQIIVPEAYTANGTLPVYEAKECDFTKILDKAWFNQSGVAEERFDTRYNAGTVDFNDGGYLSWDSYTVYYQIFDGTYEAVRMMEDGSSVRETQRKFALVTDVCHIASWMTHGFPGTGKVYSLEKTQLETISLDEAKAQAEALLSKLGVTGYICDTAMDMGVDRIHEMGALFNEAMYGGKKPTNAFLHDYFAATAAEEGYFLVYHKFGSDGNVGGQFRATFYVTADGIKVISLYDAYEQGDIVSTPAALVDAKTVVAALQGEINNSRWPDEVTQIKRAALTWMPVRADKGDGMVMTPVWVLSYITAEDYHEGFEAWAAFDAVSGKLIDAVFN